MKNWGREFGLVEIRKRAAADTGFWGDLDSYTFLTSEVAMEATRYKELAPWTRATARAAAAGLTADTAVVSGKSAARLWEIEVLGWEPVTEFMHIGGRQASSRRFWPPRVRFRYCHLDAAEVHAEHGLRVTTVLRTLRDITRYHGLMDGVVAIDSVRRQSPELTTAALHEGMTSGAPYWGIGLVRKAIDLSIPNSGSALESQARFLLLQADLPEITSIRAQARFFYDDHRRYFDVDLLVNGWLSIEVDGEVKYDGRIYGRKTEDVLIDERRREKILQNAGNHVIRVGAEHLVLREDGRCGLVDLVENALRTFTAPRSA